MRRDHASGAVSGGWRLRGVRCAMCLFVTSSLGTWAAGAATTTTAVLRSGVEQSRPDVAGGAVPLPASVTKPLTGRERRILRAQSATAAEPVAASTSSPTSTTPTSTTTTSIRPTSTTRTTTSTSTTTSSTSTTSAAPSTTTTTTIAELTLPDGRLTRRVVLANGAFTFEPPGTQRPKTRERDALAKGRSTLRAAERGAKAEVFFGLFRASAPPERDPASGQLVPVFDARPVWVVHYRDVPSTRAAPITIRPRVVSATSVAGTVLETTTSTSTTVEPFHTDILVVFDDRTGAQILRSEFASESVR